MPPRRRKTAAEERRARWGGVGEVTMSGFDGGDEGSEGGVHLFAAA